MVRTAQILSVSQSCCQHQLDPMFFYAMGSFEASWGHWPFLTMHIPFWSCGAFGGFPGTGFEFVTNFTPNGLKCTNINNLAQGSLASQNVTWPWILEVGDRWWLSSIMLVHGRYCFFRRNMFKCQVMSQKMSKNVWNSSAPSIFHFNHIGISCLHKTVKKINFLPMVAIGLKFGGWVAGTKWVRTISH